MTVLEISSINFTVRSEDNNLPSSSNFDLNSHSTARSLKRNRKTLREGKAEERGDLGDWGGRGKDAICLFVSEFPF